MVVAHSKSKMHQTCLMIINVNENIGQNQTDILNLNMDK